LVTGTAFYEFIGGKESPSFRENRQKEGKIGLNQAGQKKEREGGGRSTWGEKRTRAPPARGVGSERGGPMAWEHIENHKHASAGRGPGVI